MAHLSCSSRPFAFLPFSPPLSTRLLAHSRSCSRGKSPRSVTCRRVRANLERECDSANVAEVWDTIARGQRQRLRGTCDPFRTARSRADDFWPKGRRGGGEEEVSAAAPEVFDDEKEDRGGVAGMSVLLHSCAGITLTPGIASALTLPAVTMQDFVACLANIAAALILLKFFDELAKRDVLDKKLSRKLVHIVVGLGYLLFWPLFSTAPYTKYLCALAPAGNAVRMLGLGFGLLENEAMIKAMSREGDRRELLKGPFFYALAVVVTTVCFWRTSPVGIVALVNLCAGDGFADIIGRNFGREFKLPWNEDKSWAGSVGMFVASTVVSLLYLMYFAHFGFLQMQPGIFAGVAIVSFFTAVVESLPISTRLDDNLTVPFAAMAFGLLILPS